MNNQVIECHLWADHFTCFKRIFLEWHAESTPSIGRTKVSNVWSARERNSIGWIFLHRQRHLRTDLADRPSFKGEKDVGDVIKFIYWNSTVSAIQRHEIHFPSNFSWFQFDSSISAICERFKPVLLFRVHFPRKMCLLQLAMVSAIYATIYSFTWRPERRWVSRVCRCNLKRAADCNFPPTDTLTIQHKGVAAQKRWNVAEASAVTSNPLNSQSRPIIEPLTADWLSESLRAHCVTEFRSTALFFPPDVLPITLTSVDNSIWPTVQWNVAKFSKQFAALDLIAFQLKVDKFRVYQVTALDQDSNGGNVDLILKNFPESWNVQALFITFGPLWWQNVIAQLVWPSKIH